METASGEGLAKLKESPSPVLQQSLKDLERAYQNFFAKRAVYPRLKKRGWQDSLRYPQGFKLDEANLGWRGYRSSLAVIGCIKR